MYVEFAFFLGQQFAYKLKIMQFEVSLYSQENTSEESNKKLQVLFYYKRHKSIHTI